jgi:hypothetical protein
MALYDPTILLDRLWAIKKCQNMTVGLPPCTLSSFYGTHGFTMSSRGIFVKIAQIALKLGPNDKKDTNNN